jgi:hypothetical protein
MTGNDTRDFTLAKRNLFAVVTSRTMATGVVVGGSLVQTLLVATSDPRRVASAYALFSKKRHRRRVNGTASNNR